ncbi:MAG TPA: bacillithiol biosynthesis cysteine-adding enzyme BshC [Longimicrobiaceae bacterium]|nr:bacillithiol biosynthesis cysteine-adding enzyme BshC [Longimicrobiaceae bacterium]
MKLDIIPQPVQGPALVADYLAGKPAASRFYPASPFDPRAFQARFDAIASRFGPDERRRAAAVLQPTSGRAAERLAQFVDQGGVVVTTGQQAGLFSGPLYTIYKALTAVRLARKLEAELGTIVLPVFWIASEDHDWDEVNHTYLLDKNQNLARVGLDGSNEPPRSMSRLPLESDIIQIIVRTNDILGGQAFSDLYLKLVRDAYRTGETVAGAFGALLREILAPFDVLLVDAADPHLKQASAGLLSRSIAQSEEEERRLRQRTVDLEEAGYHGQVAVMPGATNVFLEGDAGRERIYRDGADLVLLESGSRFSESEISRLQKREPGLFSPNVFLRPVVESAVFPVLSYVAGPGEASYFAQIGPLFELHGMTAPIVTPRASFVLQSPEMGERLDCLGLSRSDLSAPRHELLTRLARPTIPDNVRSTLGQIRENVAGDYRALIEASVKMDPNLAGALGSVRNEALAGADRAERKILAHAKRENGAAAAKLDLIRDYLYPNGAPQERVLNVIGFLARYGPGLLEAIADEVDLKWRTGDEVRGITNVVSG